jgi:hypothetical protein
VQALGPNDYLHQDQFVCWFVHQHAEKPDFPTVVLFTDEARRGFLTAMFGQKQTLMLYLFTATSNTWRELCMTF